MGGGGGPSTLSTLNEREREEERWVGAPAVHRHVSPPNFEGKSRVEKVMQEMFERFHLSSFPFLFIFCIFGAHRSHPFSLIACPIGHYYSR